MFELYPAIDIHEGRCVRLTQGDFATANVYDESPANAARRWVAEGATHLHVVDLDGAKAGYPVNTAAIEAIAKAVQDAQFVADLVATHGDAIIVGVDARDGLVQTAGWLAGSAVQASDLVAHMAQLGVARIIYTDISRDGTLSEPNYAATAALLSAHGPKIIASGGVSHTNQLVTLARLGVHGAVVGRALYTGAIQLKDALHTLQQEDV